MKNLTAILVLLQIVTPWNALAIGAGSARVLGADEAVGLAAGQNLLLNPGFELGTRNWTASGGTFASTTSSPLRSNVSATWDSSAAAQTLLSSAVAIPVGLRGRQGVASCLIQTPSGTATHTIEAYDGSNALGSSKIVSSTLAARAYTGVFTIPTSGNLQLRISSVASNEPSITIDDCYLGDAASSPTSWGYFGGVKWVAVANCLWNSATTTSYASYTADSDCTTPVSGSLRGNAIAPGTKIPGASVTFLPPGDYLLIATGKFLMSSDDFTAYYRFFDGTNGADQENAVGIGSDGSGEAVSSPMIMGRFSYTAAQSSITFSIQGKVSGSGPTAFIDARVGALNIDIYRLPTVSTVP